MADAAPAPDDIFGAAEDEAQVIEAGFLSSRSEPEAEAVEPEPEGEVQPIAEIATTQDELLEKAGRLDSPPDGWNPEPQTLDDIAERRRLLDDVLGITARRETKLQQQQRGELLVEATALYEEGNPGASIANELSKIDPEAAEDFARYWRTAESDPPEYQTAEKWLEGRKLLNDAIEIAREAQEDQEDEREDELEIQEAKAEYRKGLQDFDALLSPSDRQTYGDAVARLFWQTIHSPEVQAAREGEPYASEEIVSLMRSCLSAAKHDAQARSIARMKAEMDDKDQDLIGGYMGSPELRRSEDDYYDEEMRKRIQSGTVALHQPTGEEANARDSAHLDRDLFGRDQQLAAGWNVGPKPRKPEPKPATIDDDPLWATERDKALRDGWNIG